MNDLRNFMTKVLFATDVYDKFILLSQNEFFREEIMPELFIDNQYGENFLNCLQNSEHHNYTVFKHTMITVQNVGLQAGFYDDNDMVLLKWAALFHDTGKPLTKNIYEKDDTEEDSEKGSNNRDSFYGHQNKSIEIAQVVLPRFAFEQEEIDVICKMIKYHDEMLRLEDVNYESVKELLNNIDGDRHVFDLIIELKRADAMAKKEEYRSNAECSINEIMKLGMDIIKYEYYHMAEKTNENEELDLIERKSEKMMELEKIVSGKSKLYTVFQPIIDVKGKRLFGFEALSRIDSKNFDNIIDVINTAKDSNKIFELDKLMLETAIESFKLKNKIESLVFIFINLEAETVCKLGREYLEEISKDVRLVIEISNGNTVDKEILEEVMNVTRGVELNVLINNYMLNEKKEIEPLIVIPDMVKLDMEIIRGIGDSVKKQYALKNILTYTFVNNIKVIAEGIETKGELDIILANNIDIVQGYLFGKPNKEMITVTEETMSIIDNSSKGYNTKQNIADVII